MKLQQLLRKKKKNTNLTNKENILYEKYSKNLPPNVYPIVGRFSPRHKSILTDLLEYIKNSSNKLREKDNKTDNFKPKDELITKFWTGYNFNYDNDKQLTNESKMYKLSKNLPLMTFINYERSNVTQWYGTDPANGVYFYPGWKKNENEKVGSIRFHKLFWTDPKVFLDKILNQGLNLEGTFKGGKTRKQKKSKTQKAGRKNKKTMKH
jgi:hypothetical protein